MNLRLEKKNFFRSRLGPHSLVYGAEMDGLIPGFKTINNEDEDDANIVDRVDLNASSFVELKTSRKIDHPGQLRSLRRFKLIKWWCQSYAVGIGVVCAGMRDDDGRVLTLDR